MAQLRAISAMILAGVLVASSGIASAQSFDNFGNGGDGLDGATPPGQIQITPITPPGQIIAPSINEDLGLVPPPPVIELEPTDGQSGVLFRPRDGIGGPVTSVSQPQTQQASRVILRALDRTLGRPTDIDMEIGETVLFGRIAIRAVACRYPATDPDADAYAHLEVLDRDGNTLFDGWMIASSPALSALEHPRYDVWILRCSLE